MTFDDVKRVFHATPSGFAPYLEYAYSTRAGIVHGGNTTTDGLAPHMRELVVTPNHYTEPEIIKAVSKVLYHNDADIDLTMYGLLWRKFLAFMGVRQSETVTGRLAYYQSLKRRESNILTPIKIRRFLTKYDVFNEWGDRQQEMQELFANYLDTVWLATDNLDVRTLDHDDVDGWDDAFNKIRSCMSRISEHGVGVRNSYLCYMTKHHGLADNGVRLTVLYHDNKPVARTLTYENEYGKFYVRNYGDDRLVRWLDANGYEHAGTLPLGTLLYTWLYNGLDRDDDYTFDLVHPYIDGDNNRADLIAKNGKLAFVVADKGRELDNASGSLGVDQVPQCCTHCGAFADTMAYHKYALLHPTGNYYARLCKDCAKDNVVTVDKDTPYEVKAYSKYVGRDSMVFTHNGELFSLRGLEHLGLVVVDGKVVPESETAKVNDAPVLSHMVQKTLPPRHELFDVMDNIQTKWANPYF